MFSNKYTAVQLLIDIKPSLKWIKHKLAEHRHKCTVSLNDVQFITFNMHSQIQYKDEAELSIRWTHFFFVIFRFRNTVGQNLNLYRSTKSLLIKSCLLQFIQRDQRVFPKVLEEWIENPGGVNAEHTDPPKPARPVHNTVLLGYNMADLKI